ncbi:hypothetical protein FOZ62_022995 [Perkinsus olseni]|uniref:Uncharacterized protein n=1 Tax=Perkinsus olseni TaxID=32597 RepID=A0A7J6QA13_PEROL|nr:hypothetical protein FOZ62_022995 [Perkinsus olseni]
MAKSSTTLVPTLSVDQFLALLNETDFKDKSFKILGGLCKLQALAGHPAEKDLMAFARVLSMARKYIKFGKSLQSARHLNEEVGPVGDLPANYVKFEEWVDFVQLLVEDVNTLQKGRFLKALGFANIPRLDRLEDQAWWLWSGVAGVLYYAKFKVARDKWVAAKSQSSDPDNNPKVKAAYVAMIMQLSALVKICCEFTESTLALGYVPKYLTTNHPKALKVVQVLCALTSATSSMHKLLMKQKQLSNTKPK